MLPSYIQHLQESRSACPTISTDRLMCVAQTQREKCRELVVSMSDPLLLDPKELSGRRGVRKTKSSPTPFTEKSSLTNAKKPTRRSSIKGDLLVSESAHQSNAARPVRRGSFSKSKSFPGCSKPTKACFSMQHIAFRAQLLSNALNDMDLFDEEPSDFHISKRIIEPMTPAAALA